MEDVEYVKEVLAQDYRTEHQHEISYPELERVIEETEFDFLTGRIEGEVANGSKSREGQDYLWFKCGDKSILSHRFIVAVTLNKWAPRDFDVDHINHDPSDNSPANLRVVTRRDNAGNRRSALLSDLADFDEVAASLAKRAPKVEVTPIVEPQVESALDDLRPSSSGIPSVTYTGETKPAEHSNGIWRKTNLGSWHLHFDETPRLKG